MVGLALTILSFVSVLLLARRSLSSGLGALLAFGYFYGILRARFPDGFSHFIFDAGLIAFYLGAFTSREAKALAGRDQLVKGWVVALMLWPAVTMIVSPFLDSQHILIQIIGYRAAALMLPMMLIGARLDREHFTRLSTWVLWLNAAAFVVAVLEYRLGVERFFPRGPTTQIIYASNDIGGGFLRIPSVFNSAHAFAGTMLASLPVLLHRFITRRRGQWLTVAVIGMTMAGIFMSGARLPVVQLAGMGLLLFASTRLPKKLLFFGVAIAAVLAVVVAVTPRLQRFTLLSESSSVQQRVSGSLNEELLAVLVDYPAGAGLGSAVGTSIPFFLMHLARPQIGLESEFSRIALEQGVVGLVLWLSFIAWLVVRYPRQERSNPLLTDRAFWLFMVFSWISGLVGAGLLTSIPAIVFLFLSFGAIAAGRRKRAVAPISPSKAKPPPGSTVPGGSDDVGYARLRQG